MRRTPLAIVGLLLLLPLLAACGGDDAEISTGQVVPARRDAQFVEGRQSLLALPLGRLEISLGDNTTSLAAEDTRQLEALQAPAGTTFVPITWQYDAGTFGDYKDFLLTDASPLVELVVGGAHYRLPSPDESDEGSESFYVLVQGDGDEPSLSVDYDGVTQTVDLANGQRTAGLAKPLYKLKPRSTKNTVCTKAIREAESQYFLPNYVCAMTDSALLPYAGGKWAKKGHQWLVLSIATQLTRYDVVAADRRSGTIYGATAVKTTFELGGLEPTKAVEDRSKSACASGGCLETYHLIFDVSAEHPTTLHMAQSYELMRASSWGGGKGKEKLKVEMSGDIPLK